MFFEWSQGLKTIPMPQDISSWLNNCQEMVICFTTLTNLRIILGINLNDYQTKIKYTVTNEASWIDLWFIHNHDPMNYFGFRWCTIGFCQYIAFNDGMADGCPFIKQTSHELIYGIKEMSILKRTS